MMVPKLRAAAFTAIAVITAASDTRAQTPEEFYRGKQVRMIVANRHRLAIEVEVDGHGLHFVKVGGDLKAATRNRAHTGNVLAQSTATWIRAKSPSATSHTRPGRGAIGVRRGNIAPRRSPSIWPSMALA
jgi:hypothetical protein